MSGWSTDNCPDDVSCEGCGFESRSHFNSHSWSLRQSHPGFGDVTFYWGSFLKNKFLPKILIVSSSAYPTVAWAARSPGWPRRTSRDPQIPGLEPGPRPTSASRSSRRRSRGRWPSRRRRRTRNWRWSAFSEKRFTKGLFRRFLAITGNTFQKC